MGSIDRIRRLIICGAAFAAGLMAAPNVTEGCGNCKGPGPASQNNDVPDTPEKKEEKEEKPCNGDGAGNLFSVFTGNLWRKTADLHVSGGVGNHALSFNRYSTSRASTGSGLFGTGHYIKHEYLWKMVDGGTTPEGEPILTIHYPNGNRYSFTHVGSGVYAGPAMATERLVRDGDLITLERSNGYRYEFEKLYLADGTHYYQLQRFLDEHDNAYALTYDSAKRFKRVTEPAGRYIEATYGSVALTNHFVTTLATVSTAPPEGAWTEVAISNTNTFRYFSYTAGGKCRVAEIQVFDENDAQLSGTPFGASPPSVAGREFDKAFDGDEASYYEFVASNGQCGLDFGSAKRIGRIRYRPATGLASSMLNGNFRGSNIRAATRTCIKSVKASDGRSVTYGYENRTEPVLGFQHTVLKEADYGDGEKATYAYGFFIEGLAPLMSEVSESRYEGTSTEMRFDFGRTNTVHGMIAAEIRPSTGEFLARRKSLGTGKLATDYSNGARETFHMDTTHEATGNVQGHTDALGNFRSFEYDAGGSGFLTLATNARGETRTYTRNGFGVRLTQTAADGSQITWARDGRNRITSLTGSRGEITTYTRDGSGRPERIDRPDGSYETHSYNGFGQVTSRRLRNGATETFAYDARGLKTSWTDGSGRTWIYAYDTYDRLASVTDPRGNITRYEYNPRGQITKVTRPDGTWVSHEYDSMGNRIAFTDEAGARWAWTYDEFRRVLTATDPLNNTTSYEYAQAFWNSGSFVRLAGPTAIVSPEGRRTEVAYDLMLRRASTTAGAGTADAATTEFSYDQVGNVTAITDPNDQVWQFEYDARNRRTAAIDPLGNRWGWTYDRANNMTSEIRPDAGVTTNVFDAMNSLLESTDPAGNSTSFGYDGAGRLVSLTDARGNTHTFEYDGTGRRTRMTYPAGSTEQWAYDPAGNVATYTTRAGQVLSYTYDTRNREVFADWSDATPDVARSYDPVGHLTGVANANSTVTFAYDAAGRLLVDRQAIPGLRVLSRNQPDGEGLPPVYESPAAFYSFDRDGNRSRLQYPGFLDVDYAYTARGQVSAISAGGPPPLATFTYDPAGNRITKSLENGIITTYAYDAASRLTGIASPSCSSLSYALNAVGNRTSRTESIPGVGTFTDAYSYDATDQLTGVNYSYGRQVSYQYDSLGNRERVTDSVDGTTTYTANPLNQYTAISNQPNPTYDPNGNLIGRAGWAYTYDAQNRLAEADGTMAGAGVRMNLAYDGLGRCVSRWLYEWDGAAWHLAWERHFTYDGWSLVAEFDGSGDWATPHRSYVHGPNFDEILARLSAQGTVLFLHDALGSTVALTDAIGNILETYRYDVFGTPKIYTPNGTPLDESAVQNRFMFTGREWINEIALLDFRCRIFSPSLGRFLQTDPLDILGLDLNLYRYASNNPINLVDPWGLCSEDPYTWSDFGIDALSVLLTLGDLALGGPTGEGMAPALAMQAAKTAAKETAKEAVEKAAREANRQLVKQLKEQIKKATKEHTNQSKEVKKLQNQLKEALQRPSKSGAHSGKGNDYTGSQ